MRKLIAQGAESKLFLTGATIVKNRFSKKYRLKEIDEKLRKFRTKREAKILRKLEAINFPSPKLIAEDGSENIEIEYIKGRLLKGILEKKSYIPISREIAKNVAILHNNHIIHGDLTTSNMILSKNNKIYFLDFGLGFFSHKLEDKAVDLHLLREALESKHYTIWEKCFKAVLQSYEKNAGNGKEVLKRVRIVENRGRYKGKK